MPNVQTVCGDYVPVEIGASGRRARAWLATDGMILEATDADVACQAMAVVLGAARRSGRAVNRRHFEWGLLALARLPAWPDAHHTLHELAYGEAHPNGSTSAIGYGYVRSGDSGHECGGALFDPRLGRLSPIRPEATRPGFDLAV